MNLFVLDRDPVKAARLQCDKHVVKMVTESAQMLSTAHRMLDGTMSRRPSKKGLMLRYWELPDEREQVLHKACHTGHPCTVWTMETDSNYMWHYEHFLALCNEYRYRYNKVHKCDRDLRYILLNKPNNIPTGPLTTQPLAMKSNPECMKEDVVESYRLFYQTKQSRFKMAWTRRSVPDWFVFT